MRLPRGVRRLFHVGHVRRDVAGDVDEELRDHVTRVVEALMAEGLTREEAEERARRRFGDMAAYRRALETIDGKTKTTERRRETMGIVWKNVVLALRNLRRSPGFAFSIITILALGIGANAVMFGVVDRLLLSPPVGVRDADQVRLMYLQRTYLGTGNLETGQTLSYPDYQDLLDIPGVARAAAYADGQQTFGHGEGAQQVHVIQATASLFPLLGVQPEVGRFYDEEEAQPGSTATAVLSHEFWTRRFGADPSVMGQDIDVGAGRYTVIGVAPPGFTGAELAPVDVWLPLERSQEIDNGGTEWKDHRNWWWVHTVVRLAPDATPEAVTDAATAAHRAGRQELIDAGRYSSDARLVAAPIIAAKGPNPSSESRVARWLAAVSLIVLLIACFNVANLLLARVAANRREVAVRLALGISRARLLGELLTESLVLALLGAAAALAVARFGGDALHHALLPDVAFPSALSPRFLAFIGVLTVVTALLAGVAPALQAVGSDVARTLKTDGTRSGRNRSRVRGALLVAQAALSVVLLVGAGLFVRSLDQAKGLNLGFDPAHVAVARLEWDQSRPGLTWEDKAGSDRRTALYREALDHVRRLPGVRVAGLTYTVPFQSSIALGRPRVPGVDSVVPPPSGGPYANIVSSGYFDAMNLRILQGRAFGPADDAEGSPAVAVITESMARGIWPAGDALGSCMYFGEEEDDPVCTTVVGVVEDSRRQDLVEDIPHWLYYVNEGHPGIHGPPQSIMVGTRGPARAAILAIKDELTSLSPEVRFISVRSLQDNIDPQLRSWMLGASMFTVFGLLALVVAAWGLYSALAFDVALRRRELGIRSALGAGAPGLVRLVLRQALGVVALGVTLGVGVSLLGAGFVRPLLFQVSPYEPWVYLVVAGALLMVAALAGTFPAWRATRVDPREALQAE